MVKKKSISGKGSILGKIPILGKMDLKFINGIKKIY